jgi:hypothetical protein
MYVCRNAILGNDLAYCPDCETPLSVCRVIEFDIKMLGWGEDPIDCAKHL